MHLPGARRPELWPNPEQFNPDRFLEARQSPYTFFPFGGRVPPMPGRSLRDVSDEDS